MKQYILITICIVVMIVSASAVPMYMTWVQGIAANAAKVAVKSYRSRPVITYVRSDEHEKLKNANKALESIISDMISALDVKTIEIEGRDKLIEIQRMRIMELSK